MIFGTDGIRGKFGTDPLCAEIIKRLSGVLRERLPQPGTVVIGSDPRYSSNELKGWITSGLEGVRVLDLDVVPTPVVAFETRARAADLGIMITASHNPAEDNGLKFFDGQGLKVQLDQARAWSEATLASQTLPGGGVLLERAEPEAYRNFILRHFRPHDFRRLRLAFDFAQGAGSHFLKPLIAELEIDALFIGDQPDGHNINDGFGATQTDALARFTRERGLQVGFALDGDGDRVVLTAAHPIHGDITFYALYRALLAEGLDIRGVVGTIVCGLGLEQRLEQEGISFYRTPVGDQHVLAELVKRDLLLGGEPSGHLIQSHLFPAGDGFLAALSLAKGLRRDPELIRDSEAAVPRYPVYESAIPVTRKPPLEEIVPLWEKLASMRERIGDPGRLIVRYSGTEQKLRIYAETPRLTHFSNDIRALESIIAKELT